MPASSIAVIVFGFSTFSDESALLSAEASDCISPSDGAVLAVLPALDVVLLEQAAVPTSSAAHRRTDNALVAGLINLNHSSVPKILIQDPDKSKRIGYFGYLNLSES
jgi:hypothetical protein